MQDAQKGRDIIEEIIPILKRVSHETKKDMLTAVKIAEALEKQGKAG